ncbi:hypothetical protein WN55_02487 [Dufourea novaeangliae]|uniref:Uncharacterized protein n=1 Tax=Dufourea novaeangliae TaxID=178035 RepID=A0A154PGW8_DUFNO|nr:hypothetical protein WN55_02487 [Dufourea novaeangliae]
MGRRGGVEGPHGGTANYVGVGGPLRRSDDISGEIFRKLDRSADCRCSRWRRPISVAPGRASGGQPRLKRGHSPWSCQSSVGHGHAHSSRFVSIFFFFRGFIILYTYSLYLRFFLLLLFYLSLSFLRFDCHSV